MAQYFLDTSAIVKRYASFEAGHFWVDALCAAAAGNVIFASDVAVVEVVAAFCRMARTQPPRLSEARRNQLIALFRAHDGASTYAFVAVDHLLCERAADLCLTHPLRAYDAVQLACALVIRDQAAAARLPPPTFVSADIELLAAAVAEGLTIENPNGHP